MTDHNHELFSRVIRGQVLSFATLDQTLTAGQHACERKVMPESRDSLRLVSPGPDFTVKRRGTTSR